MAWMEFCPGFFLFQKLNTDYTDRNSQDLHSAPTRLLSSISSVPLRFKVLGFRPYPFHPCWSVVRFSELTMVSMDPFLQAAIKEALQGLAEGGIPIGSVVAPQGKIMGR